MVAREVEDGVEFAVGMHTLSHTDQLDGGDVHDALIVDRVLNAAVRPCWSEEDAVLTVQVVLRRLEEPHDVAVADLRRVGHDPRLLAGDVRDLWFAEVTAAIGLDLQHL